MDQGAGHSENGLMIHVRATVPEKTRIGEDMWHEVPQTVFPCQWASLMLCHPGSMSRDASGRPNTNTYFVLWDCDVVRVSPLLNRTNTVLLSCCFLYQHRKINRTMDQILLVFIFLLSKICDKNDLLLSINPSVEQSRIYELRLKICK